MIDDKKFLADMEEALEMNPGTLHLSDPLETLAGWDSLAALTFLAMADTRYSVKVANAALTECETVQDLFALLEKK